MAGGAKSQASQVQKLANISVQTSSYGGVLPIVYGTARVAGNMIWYGDFQAFKTGSGGKAGGAAATGYTYQAAVILALCEGPIGGIGYRWRNSSKELISAHPVWTIILGNRTQSPWSYLTTYHPTEAIGYAGTAIVCEPTMPLGSSAQMDNFNFEVKGFNIIGGANPDAHPADIIYDLLTNTFYGAAWPSAMIASLSTGPVSYRNYCTAFGLFLSFVVDTQKPVLEHLKEILDATNSAAVWSQGVLKIIPYGDTPMTSGGTTYTPNTSPVYDLGVDDFIVSSPTEDPITIERISQADTFNCCPVEFSDRTLDYNTNVLEDPDPVDVEAFGLRKASVLSLHSIKSPVVAIAISRILAQRQLYQRNTYTFNLGFKYVLLEPMDLVTLTEPTLGLDHKVVRITGTEEDETGLITVTAMDWPFGIATATQITPQGGINPDAEIDADPGDATTPFFVNAPPLYTGGVPTMMVATAGGDHWGGCYVWISYDGTTYFQAATVNGKCRYGVLTASLASALAHSDTSHTLSVDLSVSGGDLQTVSAADADDMVTLCAVANEFVSYKTATLTSANHYDLTTLRRFAFGTNNASYTAGAQFARIDENVAQVAIPVDRLGTLVYVKLQSYNLFGQQVQDLSSLTPYTFTPATVAQLTPGGAASNTLTIYPLASVPSVGANEYTEAGLLDTHHLGWNSSGHTSEIRRAAYARVAWAGIYVTPWPSALLYGYKVAIYTGSNPDDPTAQWIAPVVAPSDSVSALLRIPTPYSGTTTLLAAVKTLYLCDGGKIVESVWYPVAASATVTSDKSTI